MPARPRNATYDVVIVGAGHNGLTAAAYLARAGRSVLVLERLDRLGGAAVSEKPFSGVDVRLSRYAYLVSLLPAQIVAELGLGVELRRRRISSYTPVPGAPQRGLLVDNGDAAATRAGMTAVSADPAAFDAWTSFYARIAAVAARLFPTVLEPLRSREELRAIAADDEVWRMLFEEPISQAIEATFTDDTLRGIVLTDALIGTFSRASDADLRQNRCFLYHVIGNGTGDWDVPVGGMGAVTAALEQAARAAGAELLTGAAVEGLGVGADGVDVDVVDVEDGSAYGVRGAHVLSNVARVTLARLLGEPAGAPPPQGAQLKVNMLLRRLPRLRESAVDPRLAFAGTFHINEGYAQLDAAHAQAAGGAIPELPPCEIYCHSLTDTSILGPELVAAGAQTLTLFGLHMPADLFRADNDGARERALRATLRSLNSVLDEPIEDCLWEGPEGLCIEARTPLDLEAELGLPAGNIFHDDLRWPFAELARDVGRWGVETAVDRVLLCGAGARRGGGVSGIPGRAAAMALLQA